ncbi:MAG: 3-isopropylmalate dehydratase small subunit [Deltaproteobacteria bacterium]|nr:3-isopropylmalate dehydratase small subunit [Deltaproteobacteria bacterium]MBW2052783.1 3-isopropylmalate dehydratase small subunit [Deltaproteobacteria bacterium]MBW2140419.1 3-isopropylmalate dehydratase small subunit [Deltaproteobacteria bacterium]
MKYTGHTFVYGDDVDTDVIIPARYLKTTDAAELASHCMEDIDPAFVEKVQSGDVIVAGKNYGCGSSREQAPIAIKTSGISCVVAHSFARIFYRNAFNIGLVLVECADAAENFSSGERIEVDLEAGHVKNLSQGKEFTFKPIPEFMLDLVADGGLIPHILKKQK